MTPTLSRIPGLYRLPLEQRIERIARAAGVEDERLRELFDVGRLTLGQADRMIENVVAVHGLPLGIATNMRINGHDVLIPMAIEEPSVVAGLSFAAKLARQGGGFTADADPPHMIGQIQLLDVPDSERARHRILQASETLLDQANASDPVLTQLGGGAREIEVRQLLETSAGPMLVVHLIHDVRDAMGANAVNTACERLAPQLERLSGGRVGLSILSNLADRRLARARCLVPASALAMEGLTPQEGVQRILEAQAFAEADPYRATTHNKGIMNGIDAVAVATGNDWRALEAGAHAYAARDGRYRPLSSWRRGDNGGLEGSIELPIAAGIIGGATRAHPTARLSLAILGVETAQELARVMAAVGLAQNLAALRALAMEGIQRGHMRLHARQVAMAAGATGDMVDRVAQRMVQENAVRSDRATEILADMSHD